MIDKIDQIPFNASPEKVREILGQPLSQRGADDNEYWQYGSSSTSQATWIVFSDGRVAKIVQPGNDGITLEQIIAKNGYPEYSGKKTEPGQVVDRTYSLHYYPQLGMAYIFEGDDLASSLQRTEQVDHLTTEKFLLTLPSDYEAFELPHAMVTQESVTVEPTQVQESPNVRNVPTVLIGILLVGAVITAIVILLLKKRKSWKITAPKAQPTSPPSQKISAHFSTQAEIYPEATSPNGPSGTGPVLRITNND